MATNTIYTHDEAAKIVDIFESVLDRYGISIPSPEDNQREQDNEAKLYGSTYSELLDDVENNLIDMLETKLKNTETKPTHIKIITGVFSGNY